MVFLFVENRFSCALSLSVCVFSIFYWFNFMSPNCQSATIASESEHQVRSNTLNSFCCYLERNGMPYSKSLLIVTIHTKVGWTLEQRVYRIGSTHIFHFEHMLTSVSNTMDKSVSTSIDWIPFYLLKYENRHVFVYFQQQPDQTKQNSL